MTIYLVRRHDGTFMRYGCHWVTDMADAQVYVKPGPAKSRVTKWARLHPDEPVPTLLAWSLDEADALVVDMSENTEKALTRIKRRQMERERTHAQWEIEDLQRKQREITARLATLSHP